MRSSLLTALLFLIAFRLNAQVTATSVWKWMNGDSALNSHGVYGTKGLAHPANSPFSRNGGRGWTDAAGDFWLFGGNSVAVGGTSKLNDLWKYSLSNDQWTWISGDSTPGHAGTYGTRGVSAPTIQPGGRTRSVTWVDAGGNIWVYGGQGSASSVGSGLEELSDMWKYNPATAEWTWVSGDSISNVPAKYGVKGVASTANSPGGRNNAACWKDVAGNFWLFGGFGFGSTGVGVGQLNDLWKYNPSTNEWTWISGDTISYRHSVFGTMGTAAATNHPGSRELTINWTDAAGKFWMFGGTGYNSTTGLTELLNELWKFDPATNQWTWIKGDSTGNKLSTYGTMGLAAPANNPGGRQGSPGWVDASGNFWTSGGLGYAGSGSSGRLSDFWKYNPGTNQWTWMYGDSSINEISVYGPKGSADTAVTPGARSGHLAWMDAAGNVYLFGGVSLKSGSSGFVNDLWKLVPDTPHGVAVYSMEQKGFTLYPNPAKEQLCLTTNYPGNIQWQIVDCTGRVLVPQRPAAVNSNPTLINIGQLSSGMYLLQIKDAGFPMKQYTFLKL